MLDDSRLIGECFLDISVDVMFIVGLIEDVRRMKELLLFVLGPGQVCSYDGDIFIDHEY